MSDDTLPGADATELEDGDYSIVQQRIIMLAQATKDLPLLAFIRRIEHSESVGSLFNPSLFMRGADKLAMIKRQALALHKFQQSIPDLQEFLDAEVKQRAVEKMQGGDIGR